MSTRRLLAALVTTVVVVGAAACSDRSTTPAASDTPTPGVTDPVQATSPGEEVDELASSAAAAASSMATQRPEPGTVPPPWLGTRVLPDDGNGFGVRKPTPKELRERRFTLPDTVPMLPGSGFASAVVSPPPADVIARSTWERGCPVGVADLAWLRVTFRGFEGARHTGELLVHRSVADDLVTVFRRLWRLDFPIEEMRVTRRDELDAPPTGDGNNTSAFVCRVAVGSSRFSEHAYGLALDINLFQNPYSKGDLVLPELASSYLDTSWRRPGMVTPEVIAAFAEIGWEWGGDWNSLKDRHHFSLHDR